MYTYFIDALLQPTTESVTKTEHTSLILLTVSDDLFRKEWGNQYPLLPCLSSTLKVLGTGVSFSLRSHFLTCKLILPWYRKYRFYKQYKLISYFIRIALYLYNSIPIWYTQTYTSNITLLTLFITVLHIVV